MIQGGASLWILFDIYVSRLFLLCCIVCSLQSWDHLLVKGWQLALLGVMFSFLSLLHMVSWARCWTWLYWFRIIAFIFTVNDKNCVLWCLNIQSISKQMGVNRLTLFNSIFEVIVCSKTTVKTMRKCFVLEDIMIN